MARPVERPSAVPWRNHTACAWSGVSCRSISSSARHPGAAGQGGGGENACTHTRVPVRATSRSARRLAVATSGPPRALGRWLSKRVAKRSRRPSGNTRTRPGAIQREASPARTASVRPPDMKTAHGPSAGGAVSAALCRGIIAPTRASARRAGGLNGALRGASWRARWQRRPRLARHVCGSR
jgi:hypothetical protein